MQRKLLVLQLVLTVSSWLIGMQSCKSPELPSATQYVFRNTGNQAITLDLYGAKADYGTNTNMLERFVLSPGGVGKTRLLVGKTYWVDWYSDDYSLNNMSRRLGITLPWPELVTADAEEMAIDIVYHSFRDTTRSVLFNGSGISSTWRGEFANGSAWDGIHEFVFRKDQSGDFTVTNRAGIVHKETFNYEMLEYQADSTGNYFFGLFIENKQTNLTFRINCTLYRYPNPTGRDSMEVNGNFYGNSKRYFIKRV